MTKETFSKALIKERERRGWSRRELSDRSGYSYATLVSWELMKVDAPDLKKFDALKKIYALEPGAIKRKVRG